jgi:anaerobic selenocysteine-containing dehydrogenase
MVFATDPDDCEDFGHDLLTGAADQPVEYRSLAPAGRAILKSAHFTPPHEPPSEERPFLFTTGRTVHHWHTRTKTARVPELQSAAPAAWVEISAADAERLGIAEGAMVRVESARGRLEAPVRITGVREGTVFAPFHYGYWDTADVAGPDGRPRAANELTMTQWDPVSKQPCYKTAAVSVTPIKGGDVAISGTPAVKQRTKP